MEGVDILQVDYDKNSVLSKCGDVILEAKRVILNEQLDRIANITLSEVNNSRRNVENCARQCKNGLNLQNDLFWKDIPPYPKNITNLKNSIPDEVSHNHVIEIAIDSLITINKTEISNRKHDRSNGLIKKYFVRWKEHVNQKKERLILLERKIEQKEKLDRFFKNIKKFKKQEDNCKKNKDLIENTNYEKLALENAQRNKSAVARSEVPLKNVCHENPLSPQIYKNRFKAQKNIITMQKTKLEEQSKLIEELKMGIIREDLLKSIENTKNNIREIFGNCSSAVKSKVPVVMVEQLHQFEISSQKAPKIVQQLEQRALERAQRRQVILERRRLIEEARQRMLEEAIENKRVLEEEERKKNLEVIKERRKKELEHEKIRQANKQKYLDSLNKAVSFHNKRLKVRYFERLYENYRTNKNNAWLAEKHYVRKILSRCICRWCDFVEDTYKLKYEIADAHFAYWILKKLFKTWHDVHVDDRRNMQVAEDVYDFRLTSNTFIHWHRYVCAQLTLHDKNVKIAENHHKRKSIFHYFYMWRSLPAVVQLEKAKELKKRKWREKVWEIIPDYKPPEDI